MAGWVIGVFKAAAHERAVNYVNGRTLGGAPREKRSKSRVFVIFFTIMGTISFVAFAPDKPWFVDLMIVVAFAIAVFVAWVIVECGVRGKNGARG